MPRSKSSGFKITPKKKTKIYAEPSKRLQAEQFREQTKVRLPMESDKAYKSRQFSNQKTIEYIQLDPKTIKTKIKNDKSRRASGSSATLFSHFTKSGPSGGPLKRSKGVKRKMLVK
jgi:hypothetical protein